MPAPRINVNLLSFVFLGVVIALWFCLRLSDRPELLSKVGASAHESGAGVDSVCEARAAKPVETAGVDAMQASAWSSVAVPFGANDAALMAEEIELRGLDGAADLRLTTEQWNAFAEVTLFHQAVRHAYEAEIASVAALSGAQGRLEIPVYGAAGDALRGAFYGGLRSALGGAVAEEVAAKLGPALEARFAGFGVAVQTLDFVMDDDGAPESSTVTRTIVFWDGTSKGSELSRRQELFFPGLEDPSGVQWGPLLARLGADGIQGVKKSRG